MSTGRPASRPGGSAGSARPVTAYRTPLSAAAKHPVAVDRTPWMTEGGWIYASATGKSTLKALRVGAWRRGGAHMVLCKWGGLPKKAPSHSFAGPKGR